MLQKSPHHHCRKCNKAACICWEPQDESWHFGTLTHCRNNESLLFDSIVLLKFVVLTFGSWFMLFTLVISLFPYAGFFDVFCFGLFFL